jgi:hypothetical protein
MIVISAEYGAAVSNTPLIVTVLASTSKTQFSLNNLFVVTKHLVATPSCMLIYSGHVSTMLPSLGKAFTGVKLIV